MRFFATVVLVISACTPAGSEQPPTPKIDAAGQRDTAGGGGKPAADASPGPAPVDAAPPPADGAATLDSAPDVEPPTDTAAPVDGGPTPDTAAAPRNRCPAGPFETPKAGASKSICGNLLRYNWTEGPTWVASQNAFFFSNFVVGAAGPGDMLKYTPATGQCETFLERVGCNGLGVSNDGQILAACHTPRALMKYDPVTKQGTVLVKMADGKMLDSPNDVIQHSNGTIYFTNPTYELAGRGQGLGPAVLRVDPLGAVTVIARGGVNGIGLSPDEKKLYVGMMGVWDLDDQGVPARRTGSFPLGGDGFAIDCAGNVYNQGGDVHNPQGQRIASVPGGTNMAFGGPDGKLLLIVRGRSAQIVEMNVPGLP